jgi:hypothetical protein
MTGFRALLIAATLLVALSGGSAIAHAETISTDLLAFIRS